MNGKRTLTIDPSGIAPGSQEVVRIWMVKGPEGWAVDVFAHPLLDGNAPLCALLLCDLAKHVARRHSQTPFKFLNTAYVLAHLEHCDGDVEEAERRARAMLRELDHS